MDYVLRRRYLYQFSVDFGSQNGTVLGCFGTANLVKKICAFEQHVFVAFDVVFKSFLRRSRYEIDCGFVGLGSLFWQLIGNAKLLKTTVNSSKNRLCDFLYLQARLLFLHAGTNQKYDYADGLVLSDSRLFFYLFL